MNRNRPGDAPEDVEAAADSSATNADEKHDKVLHTRISPSLDREIKRRARNLGMSVSTVVRNVLLHTFDLVEDIVSDSAGVALSIAGDDGGKDSAGKRSDPRNRGAADVIAWQEAVLNVNAVCERCNDILAAGTRAAVGIRDGHGPRSFICLACMAKITATRGDVPD